MSFYNSPTYHLGSLNPIFNASDYQTSASISLNESTADARYLKKSGGTLTGSLTVPNTTISTSLSVPALTFSSNQISQTVGQLGYSNSSTFSSITLTNGSTTSLASIANLPVGVYIFYYNLILSNSTTSAITRKSIAFSPNNNSISSALNMRNIFLYSESITSTYSGINTSTFVYNNASIQTIYFNVNIAFSTGLSATGLITALRIA